MKNLKLIAVLFLISACAASPLKTAPQKPNYLTFRGSQSIDPLSENPSCSPSCESAQICENRKNVNAMTESFCTMKPAYPPQELDFILPFDAATEVTCTHSPGQGSHSYLNAFYAIDLATDYEKTAPIIRAAADGVAYVYGNENGGDCPEPPGSAKLAQSSICGNSWGNHVKILHAGGYYSFYVHLDHALVKSNDVVKQGDPIGVMGWTGAAGHRHLHWSVQKLPGKNQEEWVSQIQNYAGTSVPFKFRARQDGSQTLFDMADIRCPHANFGQASDQPVLSGAELISK